MWLSIEPARLGYQSSFRLAVSGPTVIMKTPLKENVHVATRHEQYPE